VKAVAELLGTSACMYFDDYGERMVQPPDGMEWIAAGGDLAAFELPEFGHIFLLSQGLLGLYETAYLTGIR